MKSIKNLLLFIGAAALSASFFGIIHGDSFASNLLTIVCGLSLIAGYFELNSTQKESYKEKD